MSNSTASFQEIQDKFNDCRQILTAIGDEVRQSILVTLMQNTCKEGIAPFKGDERCRDRADAQGRYNDFLSY